MRHELILLPTPCGCVVVAPAIACFIDGVIVIECSWCKATYLYVEYLVWLSSNSLVCRSAAPHDLFKLGASVLEVMKHCDCGAPYVRELGRAEQFHFDLPPAAVEFLSN